MENISLLGAINKVIDYLYIDYIAATIMVIWLIIKFVLPNDIKEKIMKLFSVGIAICMGFIFFYIGDYTIVRLIISGLTIVTFYELIVKGVFKALKIQYKDSDPELIKPREEKQETIFPNANAFKK